MDALDHFKFLLRTIKLGSLSVLPSPLLMMTSYLCPLSCINLVPERVIGKDFEQRRLKPSLDVVGRIRLNVQVGQREWLSIFCKEKRYRIPQRASEKRKNIHIIKWTNLSDRCVLFSSNYNKIESLVIAINSNDLSSEYTVAWLPSQWIHSSPRFDDWRRI